MPSAPLRFVLDWMLLFSSFLTYLSSAVSHSVSGSFFRGNTLCANWAILPASRSYYISYQWKVIYFFSYALQSGAQQHWCFGGQCTEILEKPLAIDGQWSEWAPWSECSRSCGAGVSHSERHCTNPPYVLIISSIRLSTHSDEYVLLPSIPLYFYASLGRSPSTWQCSTNSAR